LLGEGEFRKLMLIRHVQFFTELAQRLEVMEERQAEADGR
jgi:hypothetical protein